MTESRIGNPAVVGFAGFSVTTLLLQLHNLELCSLGPVVALALAFGGVAQLIAGLQCIKVGENFAFSAFSAYGSFWIALGLVFLFNDLGVLAASSQDIGWFMVVWTIYTVVMWVGAMRIDNALALTFTTLLIGFILLDLAHLVDPSLTKIAAVDLIICALLALYNMAHIVLGDVFGRDVLPLGKAWLK